MKSLFVHLLLAVVAATGVSACCTSITCRVKSTACKDLSCAENQLKVTNVTSQEERSRGDLTRLLHVEGCGKKGEYTCSPTNANEVKLGTEKIGLIEVEHSALDLEWRCEKANMVADDPAAFEKTGG
jgi:hypothetical protein